MESLLKMYERSRVICLGFCTVPSAGLQRVLLADTICSEVVGNAMLEMHCVLLVRFK